MAKPSRNPEAGSEQQRAAKSLLALVCFIQTSSAAMCCCLVAGGRCQRCGWSAGRLVRVLPRYPWKVGRWLGLCDACSHGLACRACFCSACYSFIIQESRQLLAKVFLKEVSGSAAQGPVPDSARPIAQVLEVTFKHTVPKMDSGLNRLDIHKIRYEAALTGR